MASSEGGTSLGVEPGGPGSASPRRSLSLSAADTSHLAGWKTPWLSQVWGCAGEKCEVELLHYSITATRAAAAGMEGLRKLEV